MKDVWYMVKDKVWFDLWDRLEVERGLPVMRRVTVETGLRWGVGRPVEMCIRDRVRRLRL